MPTINLFGSQEKGLSVAVNNQASVNCYVVPSPRGRNRASLAACMGTSSFSKRLGKMRGCREFEGKAFFVAGTSLYEISQTGTETLLGAIPGLDRVWMSNDSENLVIVNGTRVAYYYNVTNETFSEITLPFDAYTVDFLDTYLGFSSDGQRWFISEVNDTDSFNALDFASAVKSPDDLVAIVEDHSEFILMGKKTIEPWFNSGDINFAFSQNTAGVIERGVFARHSIVPEDNTIFFLGDDLIVYRMQGYNPVRVSTDSIDLELSDIRKDGGSDALEDACAFVYTEHGQKFYQLTVPEKITLVLNVATGEWHSKKHYDYETHHAVCYCQAYGKHLVGTLQGHVYEMSRNHHNDAGRPLKRLRRSHIYSNEDRMLKWKRIKFIMDFGDTESPFDDPKIAVRWSIDSGRTWRSERQLSIGKSGDYLKKAIARDCGASRSRIIEFYMTDDAPFHLVDAYATIS